MPDQLTSLAFVVQHCQTFAKQRLRSSGDFAPFGAYVSPGSTNLNLLGATSSPKEPDAAKMYQSLESFVRQLAQRGELGAYAIAASVSVPEAIKAPFAEAIRVHAEAPGFSRMIYTPYRVLPYRPLRNFFVVLPCVEYGEEILVDTKSRAYAASAA